MERAEKMVKRVLSSIEEKAGKKINSRRTKSSFGKMFSKNERAQAAMEFMMTYGWAVIGVMIALAALAISGVLSTNLFVPEGCFLPAGIACMDSRINSTNIQIVITNNAGGPLTIINATVTENNGGGFCYTEITPYFVKEKESAALDIIGCDNGVPGEKYKGKIILNYKVDNLISHEVEGTIAQEIATG